MTILAGRQGAQFLVWFVDVHCVGSPILVLEVARWVLGGFDLRSRWSWTRGARVSIESVLGRLVSRNQARKHAVIEWMQTSRLWRDTLPWEYMVWTIFGHVRSEKVLRESGTQIESREHTEASCSATSSSTR